MHEISIAESILEIAEAEARRANASAVLLIRIRLGEFTTIVREALEFAFEIARQQTIAAQAQLEIEVVPTVVECVVCHTAPHPITEVCFVCRECGFPLKIVSGEELQIEYIEVETEKEQSSWNESQFKPAF